MSGNDLEKFRFPKTLSEQNRIIGLPLDEAIPAAVLVLGIFRQEICIWSDYCDSGLAANPGGKTRKEFPLVI